MGFDFRPGHRPQQCLEPLRRGEWLPWTGLPSAGLGDALSGGGAARLGGHPVHGSLDSIYLSLFGGEGEGGKQKPNRNNKLSHGPQAAAADTGAADPGAAPGPVPSAA